MRVVNVKAENCSVYCGRSSYGRRDVGLGNPFVVGKHGNREACITYFGELLFESGCDEELAAVLCEPLEKTLERRKKLHEAIANLVESDVLGCWCKPLSCHADLIHLFWLKQQNKNT
jgi:hypothetical protein